MAAEVSGERIHQQSYVTMSHLGGGNRGLVLVFAERGREEKVVKRGGGWTLDGIAFLCPAAGSYVAAGIGTNQVARCGRSRQIPPIRRSKTMAGSTGVKTGSVRGNYTLHWPETREGFHREKKHRQAFPPDEGDVNGEAWRFGFSPWNNLCSLFDNTYDTV